MFRSEAWIEESEPGSGGKGPSTSLASDILTHIEMRASSGAALSKKREPHVRNEGGMNYNDTVEPFVARSGRANGAGDPTMDVGSQKNGKCSFFSGTMRLRPNVSMYDHLHRLLAVLSWCDMYEGGRWIGIKRFIDCYFSLVFKPYLGHAYRLNVIHVAKMRKICTVCTLNPTEKTCTLLVMLNYPLWDKILQVAAALPDRYFRKSVRQRLILNETRSVEPPSLEPLTQARLTGAYRVSVAALCMIDRLEFSMQTDLHTTGLDHVVCLSQFLANSYDARHMFRTNLVFE